VLGAARELGYRPNRTAASLRAQRTQVIGFVAPHISEDEEGTLTNYGVHPFVVGLSRELVRHHHHLAYTELGELKPDAEHDLPVVLQERFFDAFVVHHGPPGPAREVFERAQAAVLWWDCGVFEDVNCLYRDELSVATTVTERLIALGHRRIALLVSPGSWGTYRRGEWVHYSFAQRHQGYCAALRAHGLEPIELVGYDVDAMAAQLARRTVSALIINGTGHLPAIATQAANRAGLSVPRDLSIASLDVETRLPQGGYLTAGMTYDRVAAGQQAARMLLAMLQSPSRTVPRATLLGEFREGESLGAARRRN
jgi:LacI family transcriptional regulator